MDGKNTAHMYKWNGCSAWTAHATHKHPFNGRKAYKQKTYSVLSELQQRDAPAYHT